MNNMKLGTKLYLGFASLAAIALLLGGMAVWKMAGVQRHAATMAADYMPALLAANNLERESLMAMQEMRGYAFTDQGDFLTSARANLGDVKKGLEEAKALAVKSGGTLAFLKQAAEKMEAKALAYEQLANQTVNVTEAMRKDCAAMDKAAQDYMKRCYGFLASQNERLQAALSATNQTAAVGTSRASAGVNAAEVEDCVNKLELANDLIDLGNAIHIGSFKAQANRDPACLLETQKKFTEVNRKWDDLKALTKQEVNLKDIADCRVAGQAYNDAMTSFLKNWVAHEELGQKRDLAADAVLAEAKTTATASADTSGRVAASAAGALSTASTTMMVGLSMALVVGVLLALWLNRSITPPAKVVAETLSAGPGQTASAARRVSSARQPPAEGAGEQAASLDEIASALEEMSSLAKRNAKTANKLKELGSQVCLPRSMKASLDLRQHRN